MSGPVREHKHMIAREIYQQIKSQGGRFLRKGESPAEAQRLGISFGTEAWVEVDAEIALNKVKQALRDRNADDNELKPRKRKRVTKGNLVPTESSTSELGSSEGSTPLHAGVASRGQGLGNILFSPVAATFDAGIQRNTSDVLLPPYQVPFPNPSNSQTSILLQSLRARYPDLLGMDMSLPLSGLASAGSSASQLRGLPSSQILPSFGVAQALQLDPLLGSIPNVARALTDQEREIFASQTVSALAGQGVPTNPLPPSIQTVGQSCETILIEACSNRRAIPQLFLRSTQLSISLFEVSLLMVLSDHGLPLVNGNTVWTWEMLAKKVIACGGSNPEFPCSYTSLASKAGVTVDYIERASALAGAMATKPDELARSAVMLLAKIDQAALQSDTKLSTTLQQWATQLQVATETGQTVSYSHADLSGANFDDKGFGCVAQLEPASCSQLVSTIGTLSRLRGVLAQHQSSELLSVLSKYPNDTYKPLNESGVWWVGTLTPTRDLWLIQSVLDHGIKATLDLDATTIGAPQKTLRLSSVSSRDVELRLEKLSLILSTHFDSQSRVKITQERSAAWRTLLR